MNYLCGAKLAYEKIRIPSKSTKKQSKPGWEIRLETQIKKIKKNLRKQPKMVKQKYPGICGNRMEKDNTRKNNSTTGGNNQKVLA